MSSISIDDDKLKGLVKQALPEVLQESRGLLYEIIVEAGEDSPLVDKAEVIKALESES